MKEKNDPSFVLSLRAPWDKNANVIWLASSLRLHRNVEKFKFPHKISDDRRKQIISLVSKAILGANLLNAPVSMKSEELNPLEKDYLAEHYLVSGGVQDAHQGEAFIFEPSGEMMAMLNLKDHIQLQVLDTCGELEKAWNRLIQIENAISPSLSLSFSPRFGFLCSDPSLCGTGFVISSYLHVPALVHSDLLHEKLDNDKTDTISLSGMQGRIDNLIGDILIVQNNYCLGVSEESIISTLRNVITRLVIAEKGARSRIKTAGSSIFQDKISRALGILKFSYQMDTSEALASLSMVKLGIELGWVIGMSVLQINSLLFNCRRAHLLNLLSDSFAAEELHSRRATYLRDQFQPVSTEFKPTIPKYKS